MKTKKSSASRLPAGAITRYYVRFRDGGLRYAIVWARTRDHSIKEVRARFPHLLASEILGSATVDRKPNLAGYKHSGEFEAGTHRRSNPAVQCSANKKRDKYRGAKVMHNGEWVQNNGCWDAKGVPSYVGKNEGGKRRVIAKKVVRQKASRTPSRVKGVRARKRS